MQGQYSPMGDLWCSGEAQEAKVLNCKDRAKTLGIRDRLMLEEGPVRTTQQFLSQDTCHILDPYGVGGERAKRKTPKGQIFRAGETEHF